MVIRDNLEGLWVQQVAKITSYVDVLLAHIKTLEPMMRCIDKWDFDEFPQVCKVDEKFFSR